MTDVLGQLAAKLDALAEELALLRAAVAAPAPVGVWSAGAVTVPQAAELYGVSRATLDNWMRAGRVVWSQPMAHRMIARRSLEALLERHEPGRGK